MNKKEMNTLLMAEIKLIGTTDMEKRTGIPRTHFYKMFSDLGNPSIDSLMKVAKALGYEIRFEKV